MRISALVLPDNQEMVHVLKKSGFNVAYDEGECIWKATLENAGRAGSEIAAAGLEPATQGL